MMPPRLTASVPPDSAEALLARCSTLAGRTVASVANELGVPIAGENRYAKGLTGHLLEWVLGADGGNQAKTDFSALHIELKTLPISSKGVPLETTYVCTLPQPYPEADWETSWVRRKLLRVLWFPIITEKGQAFGERVFGGAFISTLSPAHDQQLKQDWLDITAIFAEGNHASLNSQVGEWLHVRPKAANSRQLVSVVDAEGDHDTTVPKGFYLRKTYTQLLLETYTRL